MVTQPNADYYFKALIERLFSPVSRIKVPKDFHGQMTKINQLLENDYTGIVGTIYDFMVTTGSIPMTYVTNNPNLTKTLNDWATTQLNKDIHFDIPRGLTALTEQYMRERYKSSFLVLNIVWEKINGLVLPGKMWFSDGSVIVVDGTSDNLDGKKYYLGAKENPINSTDSKSVLIRKPFDSWYKDYPSPYLVKRGVLYNSLLKKALIDHQATVMEEMVPYILALRAGDATLIAKNAMGDIESQLGNVKESLKQAKRAKKYQRDEGDTILKGRYDLTVEHLIPDLTKLFNDAVVNPVNNDLLCGLGLVELQGFSSNRQEAILNPKVLVEEIIKGVVDVCSLYEEVLEMTIERNSELHPKQMGKDIRIVPGVIKAFLTDSMRKLIKDYTNTGELSIEDSFEALPQGFDFGISKLRRKQEAERGDEDLFFPRVILNQDSNSLNDVAPRTPTPNEVPQKKKKNIKAEQQELMAPYTKESLPTQIKNLPEGAQTIWLETFNTVYKSSNGNEDSARKAAWRNVKLEYKKTKDGWVKKNK